MNTSESNPVIFYIGMVLVVYGMVSFILDMRILAMWLFGG